MEGVDVTGYVPGAIGRITELHADYYHRHWGFGLFFESKVAQDMCEFLKRFDDTRDGFWVAMVRGRIVGSIAIDGIGAEHHGAHLRWFILAPEHQGQGIGKKLMNQALTFCRAKGFRGLYLWTFAGLDAARHLYEEAGFILSAEHEGDQWGVRVREQRFELKLTS